jgi:flavin-dependent dehydrogenase
MRKAETIIVGGGPAGSTCARELIRGGRDCLLLEAASMPRVKLCGGWVTPKVLKDLEIRPEDYPHGMLTLRRMRLCLGKKRRFRFNLSTLQYSIRRVEFDHWLLKRSGVEVIQHHVRSIERVGDCYRIDGKFECRYLVGAGGSGCPVQKTFFKNLYGEKVITKEIEYKKEKAAPECILWIPYAGKGYAWHMPKAGALNIGYGCIATSTEATPFNHLWGDFTRMLRDDHYLESEDPSPSGWFYHLRTRRWQEVKRDNAYIVGDAVGLATVDMGEGIGPAVESGLLAARDILEKDTYTLDKITFHSLPGLLGLPAMVVWPLKRILSMVF